MKSIVEIIKNKPFLFTLDGQTRKKIKEAEKELGLVFSEEYKTYLEAFGLATFENHELTGICPGQRLDVVTTTKKEREYNDSIPRDAYVIEQLNIGGLVIWQTESGEVFESRPHRGMKKIYDSLAEYLERE